MHSRRTVAASLLLAALPFAAPAHEADLTTVLQDPKPAVAAQEPKELGPGPRWRGPVRPEAANEVFATGDGCAMCHSSSPGSNAMRNGLGDDVSPHELWQGTLMANAFKDPYFHAQLQKESEAAGDLAQPTQSLCLRCHAPMAHHSARIAGNPGPHLAQVADDPLAEDGVSCTMCHQIKPDGLGTEKTFGGRPVIGRDREIFGPYADPAPGPMRMHSGYTPVHGPHMKTSAHCATCHTLTTHHAGKAFPEQTPYFEWRNSAYSDEQGATAESKTCQQCHMARTGATRIARNPMGRDFLIPVRDDYAAHAFVGGNAFILDMLRVNREELGVKAPAAALARMAAATRRQLGESTATIEIGALQAGPETLDFEVNVYNHTGHKFPTGYPARRAWLQVQVRTGDGVVFETGAYDKDGRLTGVENELGLPHVDVVTKSSDVVVYELLGHDEAGAPTTFLTRMATRGKDNRLLPRGWRADGPHAAETMPVGTESDPNFWAGSDTVTFRVPLPAEKAQGAQVVAWLHYQPIPPAWVESLRTVAAEEAKRFVRMYDAADKAPETVAVATKRLTAQ